MSFFVDNINLVLFLPLIMSAIIGFNGLISNKIDKNNLFLISIVSSFFCIVFSTMGLSYSLANDTSIATNFAWLSLESMSFYIGTLIDKVSMPFVLASAVLGFGLQIISYLKLKDEFNYPKLLLLQNLFTFALTGVFISSNLFETYLFCEIAGVASYLLINFDFSNRAESKAGIKSFIYNRIGDLALLFCVLTVLYYSVFYNQLTDATSLAYSNMNTIAPTVHSLLAEPFYVILCSMLIVVIVMKFMQAFVYIMFEKQNKGWLAKSIFLQNILIGLVGLYLIIRLNPFFCALGKDWTWTLVVLVLFSILIILLSKLFLPLCRIAGWVEKYIVDTTVAFGELFVRAASFACNKFQAGNFQSYIIYSIIGLVLIMAFVLMFYEMLLKV